jgi:hypothetical protein
MAYDYYELLARARVWAETAQGEGRLQKEAARPLFEIDSRSADSLFAGQQSPGGGRPLIVAFMGGTGVGKSSLLNRLAGQAIAKAGVERPTSREVTLYQHQALAIAQLPAGLPLDSVKICRHAQAQTQNIVWIDMPDFDSIELGNKRQVLEWLPHIDVLLYVVSPERYRDNKAWQLLLAEGAKHAWLFVMNQWDRGLLAQYQDFKQQLQKAGFENPLVFCTSCTEPAGDDFADLTAQLLQLSQTRNIAELAHRNRLLRGEQLQQILHDLLQAMAGRDFPALQNFYAELSQKHAAGFLQGLAWPLQQLSRHMAEPTAQKADIKLWDAWAQSRFNDLLDELALQAAQQNISSQPLKAGLRQIKQQAEKTIVDHTELAGRQALFSPGNGAQRFFLGFTALCETLLPLAAMAAVAYKVYSGYYHSATEAEAYLGADFAVHSVLLIGLSWLIPFFLHKKIQPSLQKTALKGLQKGLLQALAALDAEIRALLIAEQNRNVQLQRELADLLNNAEPVLMPRLDKESLLGRVLLD